MKAKVSIPLFIIFLLSLIFHTTVKSDPMSINFDFDEFLQDETPLQLSIKGIKDYFKSIGINQDHLKARSGTLNSTNENFNNAFMYYVTDIYNKQGYGRALSQDGNHIVEFLDLCNSLHLDTSTVYVCLRLFHNKMKCVECELIDDTVMQQLLQYAPALLEPYFKSENAVKKNVNLDFLRRHTEETMLNAFINRLPEFQKDPGQFVSSLAKNTMLLMEKQINMINDSEQKKMSSAETTLRLRTTVIRLFETILNKLVWNIKSHEGIWNSFMNIANNLQLLGRFHIIDHMDDLDDLLWSLTHRFSWFLEFAGHALPLEFYEEVETDLVNKVVFFFETPEQDQGIKTKKETLIDSLINAKTKAIAQQQGLAIAY